MAQQQQTKIDEFKAVLDTMKNGTPCVVNLYGPPQSGKSTLVRKEILEKWDEDQYSFCMDHDHPFFLESLFEDMANGKVSILVNVTNLMLGYLESIKNGEEITYCRKYKVDARAVFTGSIVFLTNRNYSKLATHSIELHYVPGF